MVILELLNTLREQLAALRALPAEVGPYRQSDDPALIEASKLLGETQRLLDGHRALVAGEIARRSTPAFGYDGLAQRAGHRTTEEFLRAHAGVTIRDAKTSIRAGESLHDAAELPDARTGEILAPSAPWMRPVAAAVAAGLFGAEHIAAIRRGLGEPREGVPAAALTRAAETLCVEALSLSDQALSDAAVPDAVVSDAADSDAVNNASRGLFILDADRLFRRARALRDELDEAGIADRERHRIGQRSLRVVPQPDGMTRLIWLLDPESAAYVADLYNRTTSPKRGGPRFVDAAQAAVAEAIELDPRTIEQLASDVFLDLLRAGAVADPSSLLGAQGAAVQLVVTREQLAALAGHGWIVGQVDPVSRETVERHLCADGHQPITVDPAGNPLDVGRTKRLHTAKQRVALGIRDGGCRFGDCPRVTGMVEAHHIDHWERDHGHTSVERGILLCRYHHLRVHNEGWEIERRGNEFVLIPPPKINPQQQPIPMPAKSPIMRDLAQRRA